MTRLRLGGRARFLLGSTEHYGALLNTAFDYERYLGAVASDRLGMTRAFGFYRELEDSIGGQLGYANTLAPRPQHYLAPWARVEGGEPSPDGLPKFDLERWDERYWRRLEAFIGAADRYGVVVELTFFCNPYSEQLFRYVPLHPASNVNRVGAGVRSFRDYMSTADPTILRHQQRYVAEAVRRTARFGNVYFELCNEPVHDPETLRAWHGALVDAVRDAARAAGTTAVVAVNAHAGQPVRGGPADERLVRLDDGFYLGDPRYDLLNVHYISQRQPRGEMLQAFRGGTRFPEAYRFGSIATFVGSRAGRKPIGFDEDYTGIVGDMPVLPMLNRMEAWESLLAGCSTYDHLDLSFTPDDPSGAGSGSAPPGVPGEWLDGRALRRQLGHVADYAAELDLETLTPDLPAVALTPVGAGAVAARSGEAGTRLSLYLADLRPLQAGYGTTPLGGVAVVAGLSPSGAYRLRVFDPRTGAWRALGSATADPGGLLRFEVLPFREDVLVDLDRVR